MSLTDLDLIRLCSAIYETIPQGFDHTESTSGITWGLKHTDDADIIVPRGSQTVEDWYRDLISEAGQYLRGWPMLGIVPLGFSHGIVNTYHTAAVLLRPGKQIVFAGHSLACAHAALMAGLHAALRRPAGRMMLAAPPRPGTERLSDLLADWQVTQYRNVGDPVPSVPVPFRDPLGLVDLPWQHLSPPFILLNEPPAPGDLSLFRCHHAALYERGIEKLQGSV